MKVELSSRELAILSDALNIDVLSDEVAAADKVALLAKLNNILNSIN